MLEAMPVEDDLPKTGEGKDNRVRFDWRISVSVMVGFLTWGMIAVWWLSGQTAKLQNHETRIITIEAAEVARALEASSLRERVVHLTDVADTTAKTLERDEGFLTEMRTDLKALVFQSAREQARDAAKGPLRRD